MASLARARGRRAATPFREISLVGSAMGGIAGDGPQCVHCGRTPLVGELVHVYSGAGGDRMVCALCRSRHREPPARTEIVHSSEHHRAVKARTRAA